MSDTQIKPWYKELQNYVSTLAEQFELDPIQAEQFRESLLQLCKRQYMAGNKSGIAWAFKKAAENKGLAQANPA